MKLYIVPFRYCKSNSFMRHGKEGKEALETAKQIKMIL